MTKKELRKFLKAWLDENQIAFDPSLNTPNLLRFAERNGFVSSEAPEGFEETEESIIEENEEAIERNVELNIIEPNGDAEETENFDNEGNENPDETGNEETGEIPEESYEKVLPTKRTVKKSVSKPVQTVENIETVEPEKKADNSWLYALLALALTALFIYLKNRNNGD